MFARLVAKKTSETFLGGKKVFCASFEVQLIARVIDEDILVLELEWFCIGIKKMQNAR